MRLCNALIKYILFISLSLFFHHCHAHEHHNHVDPVTNKLAESAVTVDPLTKPIENGNIHKTNFQEQRNDDHQHETIEARLQAKHNLRQSVHQPIDDDKEESEQEYINRLNSALEDNKVEHHFQYVPPPIADTNNETLIQNQTKEDIQVPGHTENETTSSTSTSVQTPPEQEKQLNEKLTSTVADSSNTIRTSDEKSDVKIISQEIVPPVEVQNNQQNIVKEDILFIHKETVMPAKVVVDNNPSSFNQQPSIANITDEQTKQNQTSFDTQPTPAAAQTASDFHIASEKLQQTVPVDAKSEQQDVKVEVKSTTTTPTVIVEQTRTSDTKIVEQQPVRVVDDSFTTTSTPIQVEQQQNLSSAQENQPAPTVDTLKPPETSNTESTPTLAQTAAPPTRVLRSATSRLQHRAQQRQRELREKEQASTTDNQPLKASVPTTTLPTVQQTVEEHNHSIPSDEQNSTIESTTTTVPPLVQKQFVEATPMIQQKESIAQTTQTPVVQKQESSVETLHVSTLHSNESTVKTTEVPAVQNQETFASTLESTKYTVDTISTPVAQKQETYVEPLLTPTPSPSQAESIVETTPLPVVQQQESSVEPTRVSTPSSSEFIVEATPLPVAQKQESSVESTRISKPQPAEPIVETTPIPVVQQQESSVEPTQVSTPPTVESTVETTLTPAVQKQKSSVEPTRVSTPSSTESIVETTPVPAVQKQESSVEPTRLSTPSSTESIVEATPVPAVQKQESSVEPTRLSTPSSTESIVETTQIPSVQIEEPSIDSTYTLANDDNQTNETESSSTNQHIPVVEQVDLPRQVRVHDPQIDLKQLKDETMQNDNSSLEQEIKQNTTVDSFLTNDQTRHLPRVLESEPTTATIDTDTPTLTNTIQTVETTASENNIHTIPIDTKSEETNPSSPYKSNTTEQIFSTKNRQVCWHLIKPLDSSIELIENQTLRFAGLLPEFLQTILFGQLDNREIRVNTIWFSSICGSCFFFSLIFLSMAAKRLKQNKHEKEIRARCQQLQQYNNQLELERATFERENQKLFNEIEELRNQPVRDTDEEMYQLRENYDHLHAEWKNLRVQYDNVHQDNNQKQGLIQKYHFDLQKQVENVAYLNDEILRQKQELEKERETIARLQTNDLSLERFEQLQQIINDLKSEITQLKQDKFAQTDELKQAQEHVNQLDIDNNELTLKLKQLKDLLEQRDQTIVKLKENVNNNEDSENEDEEDEDVDRKETETNGEIDEQQQRELLSKIDSDVEKANQHMRNLHSEIEEKARRLKELDTLLNQEKDRCRELETKLKVVLELRERDAHIHIRQLGQTDAELRKARTDTERVRILQQQLELKQKQLDDVQKELTNEQTKFSEECSKLQHETHEKWMEVKRLTRELDGAKKECEGLRRQITKFAQNDRSSQEKTMHKPIPQHLNNTGRLSSEPETNGSSPTTLPYQQGDNFRPIDQERNHSGAASPSDMMRIPPPLFGMPRPPFFPPPFMPPPNPFLMAPRFPMPPGGPHGMISPIPHLMTNGSAGGSDSNSFEIVDSTNITPNSTSYNAQVNGSATSPVPDDEQQATVKVKKAKKSLKKKSKTSGTTTVVSEAKEDV